MSIWDEKDDRRVEERLRQLLATGADLPTAIETVHKVDGIGTLLLCRPVETVSGLSPTEAKRLIVHAANRSRPYR